MHVPLEAIDARPAVSLLRDLMVIGDAAAAPGRIARAVARRVDYSHCSCDPIVRHATALLAKPRARVERVALALGRSERHLQRRFREEVGYGPKTLQRILRFRRVLGALRLDREQAGGLARIAVASGYSDQAHLSRETRDFSGLSPYRLARALDTLRSEGALGIFKTGPASGSLDRATRRIYYGGHGASNPARVHGASGSDHRAPIVQAVAGGTEEQLIADGFRSWNDGGWEGWVDRNVDPDVLLVDPPELPDRGTYRGLAAYKARFREWTEPLGHFRAEVTEFVHGPGVTMAVIVARSQAPASGVPMEYEVFNVFRVREGRISEYRLFLDRAPALGALGISG
jgi:AraC-like DNA-binding protein/ketosteroid isomerase-like protein